MPPMTDPERSRCYLNALENWRYDGYIRFAKDADRWVRAELPDHTFRELGRMLYEHVKANGCACVDEQVETRERWRDLHQFHHDIRMPVAGRLIYFETRLIYRDPDDPDDPLIQVVNAHDA
jgi:hypothetical protein